VLERHGQDDTEITVRKRVHEPASMQTTIAVVDSALECNQETIFESVRGLALFLHCTLPDDFAIFGINSSS